MTNIDQTMAIFINLLLYAIYIDAYQDMILRNAIPMVRHRVVADYQHSYTNPSCE
jgi:hypothetical protein